MLLHELGLRLLRLHLRMGMIPKFSMVVLAQGSFLFPLIIAPSKIHLFKYM